VGADGRRPAQRGEGGARLGIGRGETNRQVAQYYCAARFRKWPLAAVTVDRLGTTAFEGAADQMWFLYLVALASSGNVIVLHR
jgi:hypothetical protein